MKPDSIGDVRENKVGQERRDEKSKRTREEKLHTKVDKNAKVHSKANTDFFFFLPNEGLD